MTLNPSGTFSGGTTFNVGEGTTVEHPGGTYTGGVTFNVGQGATSISRAGRPSLTRAHSRAPEAARSQLSSGTLAVGIGGATFNFPGSMFQWTGGRNQRRRGQPDQPRDDQPRRLQRQGFYDDGTLDNFGTIIQTGTGNLGLHSDNQAPTVLKIEPGGVVPDRVRLRRRQTLRRRDRRSTTPGPSRRPPEPARRRSWSTARSATQGPSRPTRERSASRRPIAQVSQATLSRPAPGTPSTARRWHSPAGPASPPTRRTSRSTGTARRSPASQRPDVQQRRALSLTNGASFSTAGDFSNTGSLTIGAGSTLDGERELHAGLVRLAHGRHRRQLVGQRVRPARHHRQRHAGRLGQRDDRQRLHARRPATAIRSSTYASETGGSSLTFTGRE